MCAQVAKQTLLTETFAQFYCRSNKGKVANLKGALQDFQVLCSSMYKTLCGVLVQPKQDT